MNALKIVVKLHNIHKIYIKLSFNYTFVILCTVHVDNSLSPPPPLPSLSVCFIGRCFLVWLWSILNLQLNIIVQVKHNCGL